MTQAMRDAAHSLEASAIRSDGLTFGSVNFTPASLLLAQQRSHGRPTVVDQASPADNQMLTPRAQLLLRTALSKRLRWQRCNVVNTTCTEAHG